MTDSLDREIAGALAVDPSPDFVARVRQRIAAEAFPRTWWTPWIVAAGAALAAAAITIVVSRGSSGIAPDKPSPLAARLLPAVTAPAIVAPSVAPPAAGPRALAAQRFTPAAAIAGSRDASPEPDILVDAREARAMRIVLDGIRRGRVDLAPLAASVSSVMEPAPLAHISIVPIDTPPIVESGDSKGVHP